MTLLPQVWSWDIEREQEDQICESQTRPAMRVSAARTFASLAGRSSCNRVPPFQAASPLAARVSFCAAPSRPCEKPAARRPVAWTSATAPQRSAGSNMACEWGLPSDSAWGALGGLAWGRGGLGVGKGGPGVGKGAKEALQQVVGFAPRVRG